MLIVLLFDLKGKIYYMTYEKVMGKPHPMVRKHRLLRAVAVAGPAVAVATAEKRLQPSSQQSLVQKLSVSNASSSGKPRFEKTRLSRI